MIQPISNQFFQTGKYFTILKFIILQQNISSVWIFGDQNSWRQHGQEMDGVLQHLVGTLPKYVSDLNNTKTTCVDNENHKILNILFVTQKFGSDEQNCICPTDYTMVLVQNSSAIIRLSQKLSSHILHRIVFGTIKSSTIADMEPFHDLFSLTEISHRSMEHLFDTATFNLNLSTFRVLFQLRPPNTMLTLFDKKYILYGPDVLMAREISQMLNATVTIETNIGIEYPKYASWFNFESPRLTRSSEILKIHRRNLPSNVVSDFYRK